MKLAIALKENDYNSSVDERFGRAPFFIIIDSDTKEFEIIENEAKDEATGAGLKAVKNLLKYEIDIIIAGEIGPKAGELIYDLEILTFKFKDLEKVDEIVNAFNENTLEKYDLSPKPMGLRKA
jgi:predicted Fe-Mo cluster-binding NifX family protein